jgi:cobalt-precorrin 5A hydrolase/precorrin-3B C17-methyltransferase
VADSVAEDKAADITEPKRVALIAFSAGGVACAQKIADALATAGAYAVLNLSAPERVADSAKPSAASGVQIEALSSLDAWTQKYFQAADALIFVGATGIAVRAIAPYVGDKFKDPAVVSVDERGQVAVPLLSGHVGKANDLARRVAEITSGIAAISTATDMNNLFAVDEWAHDAGYTIADRALAKEISACLLRGEAVGFATEFDVLGALPQQVVEGSDGSTGIGFCVSDKAGYLPFERTLKLVPKSVVVGVGCKRNTDVAVLEEAIFDELYRAGIEPEAVGYLASIDIKSDEAALLALADKYGWKLCFYTASELRKQAGEFTPSAFVAQTVGVDNVCERAAVAAGATLISHKSVFQGTAVALARKPVVVSFEQAHRPAREHAPHKAAGAACEHTHIPDRGALYVVGLGPGGGADMTERARAACAEADLLVGYSVYIDLIAPEFPGKPTFTTPMRKEIDRCRAALQKAQEGNVVALVCSGDPGIYGMAGLCFELAQEYDVPLEVIPGITAASGGAAVLGAPLMHDFAVISLSDLLTPWEKIAARLEAAAQTDMVICLYNPASKHRPDYLARAVELVRAHKTDDTVCGLVRKCGRAGESSRILTLGELQYAQVDMFTTVYIGNSQTQEIAGKMVTPRGYVTQKEH